jgi:hypothetical protein
MVQFSISFASNTVQQQQINTMAIYSAMSYDHGRPIDHHQSAQLQ